VHHVDNRAAAEDLAEALATRLPQIAAPTVTSMGPVLAIHVGGGAIAVSVQLAE